MRVISLLLFIMLLNLSIPVVNYMTAPNGQPLFSTQTNNFPEWSVQNVTSGAQCNVDQSGKPVCTPTLSGSGSSFLSTMLIFGDFFGALIKFIATMIEGVVLPYFFLVNWGVPSVLAAVYNGGMWMVYFFAYITFLSGRYVE
jgi:hypothetical protein